MHSSSKKGQHPASTTNEAPEANDQDNFMTCGNLQCPHYDQQDPGGNNCSLLFVLSEEGCEAYAALHMKS